MKCKVTLCPNESHQGTFIDLVCAPCAAAILDSSERNTGMPLGRWHEIRENEEELKQYLPPRMDILALRRK